MAVLSTTQRKEMPKSEFAGPGRSFPVNDIVHADKALQFVGRAEEKGHITPEEAHHIRALAHSRLSQALANKK